MNECRYYIVKCPGHDTNPNHFCDDEVTREELTRSEYSHYHFNHQMETSGIILRPNYSEFTTKQCSITMTFDIPNDIWKVLIQNLTPVDIVMLSMTCKNLQDLLKDNQQTKLLISHFKGMEKTKCICGKIFILPGEWDLHRKLCSMISVVFCRLCDMDIGWNDWYDHMSNVHKRFGESESEIFRNIVVLKSELKIPQDFDFPKGEPLPKLMKNWWSSKYLL